MYSNDWQAKIALNLMDIINDEGLPTIPVGDSIDNAIDLLGEPEFPRGRLGRKSKLYNYLYGNLSFTTDDENIIIQAQIDLHGYRAPTVIVGDLVHWRLKEWEHFALEKGWNNQKLIVDIYHLGNKHININLSNEGKIELVTLQ